MGHSWTRFDYTYSARQWEEIRRFDVERPPEINMIPMLRSYEANELLDLALSDAMIYELCKEQPDLRQSCILAAFRRRHKEKLLFSRNLDETREPYLVLLQVFQDIQDDYERKRERHDFGITLSRIAERLCSRKKNQ